MLNARDKISGSDSSFKTYSFQAKTFKIRSNNNNNNNNNNNKTTYKAP